MGLGWGEYAATISTGFEGQLIDCTEEQTVYMYKRGFLSLNRQKISTCVIMRMSITLMEISQAESSSDLTRTYN